jgi:hypothetical protein
MKSLSKPFRPPSKLLPFYRQTLQGMHRRRKNLTKPWRVHHTVITIKKVKTKFNFQLKKWFCCKGLRHFEKLYHQHRHFRSLWTFIVVRVIWPLGSCHRQKRALDNPRDTVSNTIKIKRWKCTWGKLPLIADLPSACYLVRACSEPCFFIKRRTSCSIFISLCQGSLTVRYSCTHITFSDVTSF